MKLSLYIIIASRIQLFSRLRRFTSVERALQIHLFMQNEPNFRKSQMNLNDLLTRDYDKRTLGERGKNEPKTNPNEPNFKKAKMNVNKVLVKDYENIANCEPCKNEPKTNPIYHCVASGEAGSKPNKTNFKVKKHCCV